MKEANIADLRNRFAEISRWIVEGKSVTILKRGKAFATLSPVRQSNEKSVQLPDYEARMQRIFGNTIVSGSRAEDLIDEMRGDY